MSTEFKTHQAVFIAIFKDRKVLLCQRQNTGWKDGWYEIPSGHLEANESLPAAAKRELFEETGLKVKDSDLRLFHISQNYTTPARPYIFHFFLAERWQGRPVIKEPDECSDMRFCSLDKLPENTLPYVKEALLKMTNSAIGFSYFQANSVKD